MSARKQGNTLLAILFTISLFTAMLWSWNTLAALFGVPEIEVRHVVAAVILLAAARWVVNPRVRRVCRKGYGHEQ